MARSNIINKLLVVVLVSVSYVASGLFGLSFAISGTNATPLWPPAGIALAAMWIFGWEAWSGIFIGALLVNFLQFARVGESGMLVILGGSCAIAVGNVLEAVFAYYLGLKLMGQNGFLKEVNGVFKMVPITAFSCLFAAGIGSTTMLATGQADLAAVPGIFGTWWLGDGLAILLLAPFLTSFWPLPRWDKNYPWFELSTAYAILVALCIPVFFGTSFVTSRTTILLPVLTWLALRFSRRELLSAVVFISFVAIYATAHGTGPFASTNLNDSIISEQMFCAIIGSVMLVLSVMVSRNAQYRESLQQANEELEAKVSERTAELEKQTRILKAINSQLVVEAKERSAAEKRLRELGLR